MVIPSNIIELFNKTALIAFGTSDKECNPNINTIFWKKILDDKETIILIDNFFKTTKQNVLENEKGCISFWNSETEEGYKIKGVAKYYTEGDIFKKGKEFIQEKNPNRIPRGVIELKVEEIYILTPGDKAGERVK